MKRWLLCLFIINVVYTLHSQNLIPNHSFEKVAKIDSFFSRNYKTFNSKMNGWTSPTQSSPDIIHEPYIESMCAEGTSRIRKNFFIKPLKPKTGKIFVGIKVFGCEWGNTHCREYLQIKTLKKMEAGKCYQYSFYTNPLTNGSRINNVGVAFSNKLIEDIAIEGVLELDNRFGEEKLIAPGPGKWQQIKGIVTAKTDWNYMIIGNFFHDFETTEIPSNEGYPWGYYLVDEVSLMQVDCATGESISQPLDITIYFESNSAIISDKHKKYLQNFIEKANQSNYKFIEVIGHADEDGNSEYNDNLSMERANNVMTYLTKIGCEKSRLKISALGENVPISRVDNGKNRRVEVKARN